MSSENKVKKAKKHGVLSHPILAMILLMFWGFIFYSVFAAIAEIGLGEEYGGWGAAIGAVLALIIHKAWFRPEFKGSIRKLGFPSKDVKIAFLGFSAFVLIIDVLGFIGHEIAFTIPNLGLALMAGIGEEMFVRVLPISVMMRDWMDEKHVPFITYATAVIFGLIHLSNISVGAPVDITMIQIVIAIGIGIIFAAVYLRTGNILLCIILHTVHDMLSFMIVGGTENGVMQTITTYDAITSIIIGIVGAVVGTYLIRKAVRTDIVTVWKERWSVEQ